MCRVYWQLQSLCLLGLVYSQSLSAFLVINQTDKDRLVELQEAYRPGQAAGQWAMPIALNDSPEQLRVPAKAIVETEILSCEVLLVSVVEHSNTGNVERTSRMTKAYSPYSLDSSTVREITDDWGIVFHKPVGTPNPFLPPWAKEYGIKLIHPDLISKIESMDELPAELCSAY